MRLKIGNVYVIMVILGAIAAGYRGDKKIEGERGLSSEGLVETRVLAVRKERGGEKEADGRKRYWPNNGEIDAREKELFDETNTVRKMGAWCGSKYYGATTRLDWEETIARAACRHSRDMARRGFFSHTNPDGRGTRERTDDVGFQGIVAENLAWGKNSPKDVVKMWAYSKL